MRDEAVHDSLAALKRTLYWFVTSKVNEKLCTALYANNDLLFSDEDSGDVTFCFNEMGILNVNLNNIIFDNNFDEDDPDTIILVRLLG